MLTFRRVPKVLLPFMWAEETAEIPDDLAEEIKGKLYVPQQMANKTIIGGLMASTILLVVGILGCIYVHCEKRQDNSLVDSVDRESQASSSGIHSIMTSASGPPSVVSQGTNTDQSDKETMTDQLFKSVPPKEP
ncbi:unnamed protein product [Allacma fusca]|uniref:Uncharacterized protein n=1 Tax=Allacma fusca TaxID=39272 RepID=A0A8J2PP03_9HEXA|nr:unnamed protein product [Allacma fusca]